MSRALPEHQAATLVKYARKIYDVACRTYRKLPTEDADAVLRTAAEALRHAHNRHAGQPHSDFVYAARSINEALDSLNKLLAKRGEEAVTL